MFSFVTRTAGKYPVMTWGVVGVSAYMWKAICVNDGLKEWHRDAMIQRYREINRI